MKILIINYRFFISGGPERYMFNLIDLLESKGHKVIPFSIRYSKNLPSKYSHYFADPLSNENEIYFKEQKLNLKSIIKTLERSFYSKEVYNKLKELINDTKPDFAIVLHYLKKLSPSVLVALNDSKIPFFVRLSDYLMICPNAHLFRSNKICELCVKGNFINSIIYKCVQNSYAASIVHYLATKYHKYKKYFDLIPHFAIPSKFMLNKMIEAGYDQKRLTHLPTFIEPNQGCSGDKKKRIVFVGRIERVKGVHLLLEAIKIIKETQNIEPECLIIGEGDHNYYSELKLFASKNNLTNVKFLGKKERDEIYSILRESALTVTPSLLYDNQPNSVLESLANGTPVIAPNHGSFTELIQNGKTGFLFEPGNSYDLAKKIYQLYNVNNLKEFSENCIKYIKEYHSPETHYNKILEIFDKIK